MNSFGGFHKMNQERLDGLEKRVVEIEGGNGWHESAKYVLEKLDTLTDAVKENRTDNAEAHRALHDKMDSQNIVYANRPMECQKVFLQNRTFHWLIIVLIVLFGTSFSLSGTALKQNADHKNKVIEYKVSLDAERREMNVKLDDIQKKLNTLADEEIDETH